MNARLRSISRTFTAGFTLVELLIVMGVIGVLSVLTLVSITAISADARLSSATNTVTAALANARALAMKNNAIVLIVFRPQLVGTREQVVEIFTARWMGESYVNGNVGVIDRFVEVPGADRRRLPIGIKVAAPAYEDALSSVPGDTDNLWVTQVHLPAIDAGSPLGAPSEVPGAMIGVMYGPDGTVITQNSQSDSNRTWVDFDPRGMPPIRFRDIDYDPYNTSINHLFFEQLLEADEPFVAFAPFIAVYNDKAARERRATDWTDQANYVAELTGPTGFITQFADRIHFNRYTGVVMK